MNDDLMPPLDAWRQQFTKDVAGEVRAEAARRNVRASELAVVLGISENSMSRRMTGKQPFWVDELAVVADILNVTPESLLANARTAARAHGANGGRPVAGAGFEPATSGLRARLGLAA